MLQLSAASSQPGPWKRLVLLGAVPHWACALGDCVTHLADGAGPGLQGVWPISSQLLHFVTAQEELQSEAKPVDEGKSMRGAGLPQQPSALPTTALALWFSSESDPS